MIEMRRATASDAPAIAALHVAIWRHAYRGLMPDALLDGFRVERRTAFWRTEIDRLRDHMRLAVDGSTLLGFASYGPTINLWPGYDHEIYTLYVATAAQGRGIGRALVRESCVHLVHEGARNLVIWALAGAPSNQFYARHGGKLLVTQPFRYGDYEMEETGYGWDAIGALID